MPRNPKIFDETFYNRKPTQEERQAQRMARSVRSSFDEEVAKLRGQMSFDVDSFLPRMAAAIPRRESISEEIVVPSHIVDLVMEFVKYNAYAIVSFSALCSYVQNAIISSVSEFALDQEQKKEFIRFLQDDPDIQSREFTFYNLNGKNYPQVVSMKSLTQGMMERLYPRHSYSYSFDVISNIIKGGI